MNSIATRQFNIDAGILSSVVLLGGFRLASGGEDDPADEVVLTGTVRDFKERTVEGGHPDMEQAPAHGYGHYAGNVGLFLGADGKPVFTGLGRQVTSPTRDADGRPIAPHLFNRRFEAASGGPPEACTVLDDSRGRDALEVCLVGATFNDDGTSTWTYHVRELEGGRDLSHWNLKLDESHRVLAGTTPGYDFGVDGSTGFFGIKWDVTDGFTEGEFTIVLDGHYTGADDGEGVLGKSGKTPDVGSMFVPTTATGGDSPYPSGDGLVVDPDLGDHPGSIGLADTGAIESAESFGQWYRDDLGVNMSKPLALTFKRQDDGTYVFDDREDPLYSSLGGFFPIEGDLFGNPGGSPDRNFHFTFELHAKFTYQADEKQVFRFVGDDDVWVYIDGKLAIDLGGVHAATEQCIDLSRMGLVDGESYTLDFFFAERQRTESNFRIETNLKLETTKMPSMTAVFD